MEIESEIKEIKDLLNTLNMKLDSLMEDRETSSLMRLSEDALKNFLDEEPVLYSISDLRDRYI